MKLTNELYERMKPYERHFIRAVKAGYSLGLNAQDGSALLDIYKQAGGNKVIRLSCASCVYTMLKDLGTAWFAYTPEPEFPCPTLTIEDMMAMPTAPAPNDIILHSSGPWEPEDRPEPTNEPEVEESPKEEEKPAEKPKKQTKPKTKGKGKK